MYIASDEKKVRFKGLAKDDFLAEVRARAEEYFAVGKIPKTANWVLHLKSLTLLISYILIFSTLLLGWFPDIPRFLVWMAFGINQALIAVNIGHDSLHGSYSSSPVANKILGYLAYDCIGLSSYVWKQTHNKEHHTFTNIAGVDPDIDKPGLLRLSPHAPRFKIHAYQHLYIWFLYGLVSLNWVLFSDYLYMFKNRMSIPKSEWAPFFTFKAVNLSLTIFIPLIFSPMSFWQVVMGYLVMQFAGGFTVAVIFQLAHIVESVSFPLPDGEGVIPTNWGEHEMHTTSNFSTQSLLVTHLLGGLNFQIEHHLMPKISHCHYHDISKIVRDTAHAHGLPYLEQPTVFAAIASHARILKHLGRNN